MLQPEEIQKITFEQSVFSGYKKEDVDAFLDKMYIEYSHLYNENAELVEKLKVCISKIEEYRQDEKFLKAAIVNAQKLNETAEQELEIKRQEIEGIANKKAEEILANAQVEAQKITDESNQKIADIKEKNAREFAEQQLENANLFAAKMREYDAKIAEKQDELDALISKIDEIRASTITLFEHQISVISSLPKVEKPELKQENVIEEEEASLVVEPQDQPLEDDFSENDQATVDEIIENESEPVEQAEESVVEPIDEDDAIEPVLEQMDIEDLIAVRPSPVEPEAPVLVFDEEEDDAPEQEQQEFRLFGSDSPLIFPDDISDDEEEQVVEEKSTSRFKKKLKFGVDFDVKKDK